MTVLIVAATEPELVGLRERLGRGGYAYLVTGVGPVATAVALTERLLSDESEPVELIVNVGLAGALDRSLRLGEVVAVVTEDFGDLGAELRDGAIASVFDLGLANPDDAPFEGGRLVRAFGRYVGTDSPRGRRLSHLAAALSAHEPPVREVDGTTVSLTHGRADRIAKFRAGNGADVETMEGAAVSYAALRRGVPSLQLRAISNYVEARNREAWRIGEALSALTDVTAATLTDFRRRVRDATP